MTHTKRKVTTDIKSEALSRLPKIGIAKIQFVHKLLEFGVLLEINTSTIFDRQILKHSLLPFCMLDWVDKLSVKKIAAYDVPISTHGIFASPHKAADFLIPTQNSNVLRWNAFLSCKPRKLQSSHLIYFNA